MSLLAGILDHNARFVEKREYEAFAAAAGVPPERKLVVVACMDTRLVELLPRAMNLRSGTAKVVKTAGAIVSHPFGGVMRSILVGVYEYMAEEIAVVGHYGCGMTALSCDRILKSAQARGISAETIQTLENAGVELHRWLRGFDSPEDGVKQSVAVIRQHPLLPKDVAVHGLMMCPETGRLDLLIDGSLTVGKG